MPIGNSTVLPSLGDPSDPSHLSVPVSRKHRTMDAYVPRCTGLVRPRTAHYIPFSLCPKHIRPAVLLDGTLSSHMRRRMKSELPIIENRPRCRRLNKAACKRSSAGRQGGPVVSSTLLWDNTLWQYVLREKATASVAGSVSPAAAQ